MILKPIKIQSTLLHLKRPSLLRAPTLLSNLYSGHNALETKHNWENARVSEHRRFPFYKIKRGTLGVKQKWLCRCNSWGPYFGARHRDAWEVTSWLQCRSDSTSASINMRIINNVTSSRRLVLRFLTDYVNHVRINVLKRNEWTRICLKNISSEYLYRRILNNT